MSNVPAGTAGFSASEGDGHFVRDSQALHMHAGRSNMQSPRQHVRGHVPCTQGLPVHNHTRQRRLDVAVLQFLCRCHYCTPAQQRRGWHTGQCGHGRWGPRPWGGPGTRHREDPKPCSDTHRARSCSGEARLKTDTSPARHACAIPGSAARQRRSRWPWMITLHLRLNRPWVVLSSHQGVCRACEAQAARSLSRMCGAFRCRETRPGRVMCGRGHRRASAGSISPTSARAPRHSHLQRLGTRRTLASWTCSRRRHRRPPGRPRPP